MAKRTILTSAIPTAQTPWDDGTRAYCGASVEAFIKGQLGLKAAASDVEQMGLRVNSAESAIDNLNEGANQIRDDIEALEKRADKADGNTVEVAVRVTALETEAELADRRLDAIEDTRLPGVEGRVTALETVTMPKLDERVTDIEEHSLPTIEADIEAISKAKADAEMFVVMSDTEYDALQVKDPGKFYYIYED